MEFLLEIGIECILELLFEGGIELSSNHKVNKWIRYLALLVVGVMILAVIGVIVLLIWVGVNSMRESAFEGIVFIGVGILLLVTGVWKIRKVIKKVKVK